MWLGSAGCGGANGTAAVPSDDPSVTLLRTTWTAYSSRFIQADGRVIDRKGGGISTSEGQAYAMLRAVWMEDRPMFDRVYNWALNNLNHGVRSDRLWAWRWGPDGGGNFRVLDSAFASDGDQDAALALVMASRTWNEGAYLLQARGMLADLWEKGTLVAGDRRYLLGGDALCQGTTCRLNPSYYAPYAYRVFAREDPGHAWLSLVDTSYFLLGRNSSLTATRLPSDWLLLDTRNGDLRLGSDVDSAYSYDAFRSHWRVALDAALYGDDRARVYLRDSLTWTAGRWRAEHRLPAVISSGGEALAGFEALEMQAALMPAMRESAPDVAEALSQKLQSNLSEGFWGDRESYYLQNWAWFGMALDRRYLVPFERIR